MGKSALPMTNLAFNLNPSSNLSAASCLKIDSVKHKAGYGCLIGVGSVIIAGGYTTVECVLRTGSGVTNPYFCTTWLLAGLIGLIYLT